MPSLRKRVSSYFRQLSFYNEPRQRGAHNFSENSFVTHYLKGLVAVKEGPSVVYGKNPTDLPNQSLSRYENGHDTLVGCYTGPNGGLTAVKRAEKHLSVPDSDDIDFIDTATEENVAASLQPLQRSPAVACGRPVDNSVMLIRVAGQEYLVTNTLKSKSLSLSSLADNLDVKIERTKIYKNINNNNLSAADKMAEVKKDATRRDEVCVESMATNIRRASRDSVRKNEAAGGSALAKSKSEGNPFGHKRQGKIIRVSQRAAVSNDHPSSSGSQTPTDAGLPKEWSHKSDHVFGISASLYDKNLVTKVQNGDPIADCFGIIARRDSAILAVADGVNWGEKASIAAKSAVHGCLHYLNKTIFNDTKPFDCLVDISTPADTSNNSLSDHKVGNTREVLVCLLRAFKCAHDLILENKGMLTTLTVAVVLPLKPTRDRGESYVCCVCNVGDTLAYVYSQKYGVRELTKGSHDVNCSRDMRDALGALGPVDGTKPDLSNLTLSLTTLDRGDIVMVASDGLTDNFDPNVCRFSVNTKEQPKQEVAPQPVPGSSRKIPTKPPRKGKITTNSVKSSESSQAPTSQSDTNACEDDTAQNSPLVAQFLQENSYDNKPAASLVTKNPQSKPLPPRFSRSKTSIEMRSSSRRSATSRPVLYNEEGVPYVTPLQRYELSLLLMGDVLRRGISGREGQCATAKKLCESLVNFTFSITAAKRHTLEDVDLYYDDLNGVLKEVSAQEKKARRRRALDKVQTFPGKLDHVTVVAYNVGCC